MILNRENIDILIDFYQKMTKNTQFLQNRNLFNN